MTRLGAGATLSYRIDLGQGLSLTPDLGFTLGAQYRGGDPGDNTFGTLDFGLGLSRDAWSLDGDVGLTATGAISASVGLKGRF